MVRYGWRKREDGFVVVWDLPDGPERVPMVQEAMARGVDDVETKWGDKCRQHAEPRGIPDGWLQAHIWRESNGYARAFNPDGGRGLLQITAPALKGGRTDEELYDPDTNIEIGARYIQQLGEKYGWDFPKVSAAFNAGSVRPSDRNPWNMVQTDGHVSAEVAAYNYWLSRGLADAAKQAVALQFDLLPDDPGARSDLGDEPVTNVEGKTLPS